ncbi:MAG TPA: prepilin-type N-terminal cleavage/methylation domain-containing protein [Pseudoduganella sp.]
MKKPLRTTKQQQGVALLEALIAAVILAIGLLGTVGLQARSYAAISDAGQRAEATLAAEELLGIMNNDQANIAGYAVTEGAAPPAALAAWAAKTNGRIPGVRYSVVVAPGAVGARVDVTIRWTRRQGDQQNQHLVTSYIM